MNSSKTDFICFIAASITLLSTALYVTDTYANQLETTPDMYSYNTETTPNHTIYREILISSRIRAEHNLEETETLTTQVAHRI